jgi:hypothetical protein
MGSLRDFGKFRQTTWTTADGRDVKICDMTDQHVINVIWHINDRKSHYGNEVLQNFINEANFRNLSWSLKTEYKYPPKKTVYPTDRCNRCGKSPMWCNCSWYAGKAY